MKEFSWPVRVYYEDTDASGLVYHGNYLKYMERARTEWLRSAGHSHEQLKSEEGVIFVITQMNVRFMAPAGIDDRLEVRAQLTRSSGATLEFNQSIHRDGGELCRAQVEIGCVDAISFKPRRIPAAIRAGFADVN